MNIKMIMIRLTALASVLVVLVGCSYTNNLMMRPDTPEYQNYVLATNKGYKIVTPSCPQPYNEEGEFELSHNWGCVTTRNLGLMLADPRDLLPQNSAMTFGTQELIGGSQRIQSNHPSQLTQTSLFEEDNILSLAPMW